MQLGVASVTGHGEEERGQAHELDRRDRELPLQCQTQIFNSVYFCTEVKYLLRYKIWIYSSVTTNRLFFF